MLQFKSIPFINGISAKGLISIAFVIIFSSFTMAQTTTFTGSGNWNDAAHWDNGIPDATKDAVIASGATCTVNAAANAKKLTVESTANIDFAGQNVTIHDTTEVSGTITDNNGSGTNTFMGLVTVNVGGSISTANNSAFIFEGGIVNEGTFSKTGTGAVTFQTNAQSLSGSQAITMNGTVSIAANVTNNGTIVFTGEGNMTGAGTWTQGNGSSLATAAGSITCGFDADSIDNTVIYNRAGTSETQDVNYITAYHNLILENSGYKRVFGNLNINHDLIVRNLTDRLDLLAFTNTILVAEDMHISNATYYFYLTQTTGSLTVKNMIVDGGFNMQFNTNATINENISISNNSIVIIGSVNGPFNYNILGNISVASGSSFTNGTRDVTNTLTLNGNLTCNGTFDLYADGNSRTNLVINSDVPHSFSGTPSAFQLSDLTFNATSNTSTFGFNTDIEGSVTIGAGSTFDGGTYTHYIAGNYTNSGTLTSAGAIRFDGGNQTIGAEPHFNNLYMGGTLTKTINGNLGIAADFYINGAVTINTTTFNIDVVGDLYASNSAGNATLSQTTGTLSANDIIVNGAHIFYLNTGASCSGNWVATNNSTLTIANAASAALTYTVGGNITVTNGSTLNNGVANYTHSLTLNGSITNNGTFDLYADGDSRTNLIINSDAARTIGGTPTAFQLYNLTFNENSNTTTVNAGVSLDIMGSIVIGAGNTNWIAGANTHSVYGNWTNNGGTFTGTGSTIDFDGGNQYVYSENGFNNVSFTTNATNYIAGNVVVGGNLLVSRNLYIGNDGTSRSLNVGGDMTIDAGCGLYTYNVDGNHTLTLGGNLTVNGAIDLYSNAARYTNLIIDANTPHSFNGTPSAAIDLNNVTFNASANTTTLDFDIVYLRGLLTINNGATLIVNAATLNTYSDIAINSGGTLEINATSILTLDNLKTLTNKGTFKAVGTDAANMATISETGANGTYYIVQNDAGAVFHAKYATFERMNGGINISAGSIDNTNNFSYVTFGNNCTGSQFLNITGIDLTGLPNVITPVFNSGPTYNVTRTLGTGAITFEDASGALAGENHDQDNGVPGSLILWTNPSLTFYSTGNHNFSPGSNWNSKRDGTGSPAADADLISGLATFVIEDGNSVILNTNVDALAVVVGDGASGSLTIGNDATARTLRVRENLEVNAGASLKPATTNATHILTVNGIIENNGILNLRNNASQIVNTTIDGASCAINGTATPQFNNLSFAASSSTIASVILDVNGNVILENAAVFNDGGLNHTVAGDWTENGTGAMTGNGKISFDGSANDIRTASTFNDIEFVGGFAGFISGTVTVNGDFFIGNATTVNTNQNLYFLHDFEVDAGSTFSQTGGYSYFNGTSAQELNASNATFYNLSFNNGAPNAKTVLNDLNVSNLTVISAGSIVDGAGTNSFGNGLYVDGTCNWSGLLVLKNGSLRNNSGNSFTLGTANVEINTGGVFMDNNDAATINGNLSITSGYLVINNGSTITGTPAKSFDMSGSVTHYLYVRGDDNFPSGFGSYNLNEFSQVRYDVNMAQVVRGGLTYGGVLVLSAGNTKTADGDIDVNGYLYMYDGITFDLGAHNATFSNNVYTSVSPTMISTGNVTFDRTDLTAQYFYPATYHFNNVNFLADALTASQSKIFNAGSTIIIDGNFFMSNTLGFESIIHTVNLNNHAIQGGNNFTLGAYCKLTTTAGTGAGSFRESMNTFTGTKSFALSSIVDYNLNGAQDVADGFTYGNIEFSNTGDKNALASLDINGHIMRTGGTPNFVDGGFAHTVAGDWRLEGLYYLAPTSTITLDGADQEITPINDNYTSNFMHLICAGTGTKTMNGPIGLLGNLTVNDNVTLTASTFNITSKGDITIAAAGILTQTTGTTTFDSPSINQNLTSNANSYFGNITINKTHAANYFLNLNSDLIIKGRILFTENEAGFDANAHTINVGSHWDSRAGTTLDLTGSTVIFDGPTFQNIRTDGGETFNNVEFIGAEKRLFDNTNNPDNPFRVAGDFFINGATFNGQDYGDNPSIYVAGDWTNNGTFQQISRTTYFNGANQNISASDFGYVVFTGTGTKTLTGNISVSRNLTIDTNVTLDVGGNHNISVGYYWDNDQPGSQFICHNGTVTFTGAYSALIYTGGTGVGKKFYNLVVNKNAGSYISNQNFDVEVDNDFTISSGRFYTNAFDVYVGGNFTNNDYYDANSVNSTLFFDGTGGFKTFNPGATHTFRSIEFNAASTTYELQSNISIAANDNLHINVSNATFDMNGFTVDMTGRYSALNIGANGIFEFGDGGTLKLGRDGDINITDATSVFRMVGSAASPAIINRTGTAYSYDIAMNNGTVHAQYYQILYPNSFSITGGTIDATNNFSNGSFMSGMSGATSAYLTLNSNFADFTATNVYFSSGPTYNVSRTAGTGIITFEDATGSLAGESHDNDPDNKVVWVLPAGMYWDGNTDGDGDNVSWNDPLNWTEDRIPADADIIYLTHDYVAASYTVNIQNANAVAYRVVLDEGGSGNAIALELESGYDLTLTEDMSIGTNTTLSVNDVASQINVGGSWFDYGTFNNGNGKVNFTGTEGVFNIMTGGIGAGNSFYDLEVNSPNSTFNLTSTLDVDNDFTITDGTFIVGGSNLIYVSGDWYNNGSGVFTASTGDVIFDGSSQTITGGPFYNVTIQSGGTVQLDAGTIVNNNLTLASGILDGQEYTLQVNGNWVNNAGIAAFTQTGAGVVMFNRTTGAQYIDNGTATTTFNHIEFWGAAGKEIRKSFNLTGNLSILSGSGYVDLEANQLTCTSVSGTFAIQGNSQLYVRGANNFPAGFSTINLANNSYVRYNANMAQSIYPTTYGYLYLERENSGNWTKTASGDLTVKAVLYCDVTTTLDMANHNLTLTAENGSGNLIDIRTGGPQIIWGTGTATCSFAPPASGSYWSIDADITGFNHLVLEGNTTSYAYMYGDLTVTGDVIVKNGNQLRMVPGDWTQYRLLTSDGSGTFRLENGANLYNTTPASSGHVAFPENFSTYDLHTGSFTGLWAETGIDQTLFTGATYGTLQFRNTTRNITSDGLNNLNVRGNFYMGDDYQGAMAVYHDNGKDLYLGGDLIYLNEYTPSSSARTVFFDGSNQNIRDYTANVLDFANVVFGGSGTKTFNDGNDVVNISGNLTVNSLGVIVNNYCNINFTGDTWTNNGEFYCIYTRTVNFDKATAQTINPGELHNFRNIEFNQAGTKTFTKGLNVDGTFTINAGTVDLGTYSHTIAGNVSTRNGTLTSDNANINFDGGNQNIVTNAFTANNITLSNAGTKRMYADWDINDLTIESTCVLNTYNDVDVLYHNLEVRGNWNVTSTGYFYDNDQSKVTFNGSVSPIVINNGTSAASRFWDVEFAPTAPVIYTLETPATYIDRKLIVGANANLQLNSNLLNLGRNVIDKEFTINGTLDVNENATLRFDNRTEQCVLDVNGILKVVGTDISNVATITRLYNAPTRPDETQININPGATIHAKFYLIEYLSDEGLIVFDGANVDASNNFSDGTWSNINTSAAAPNKYYLVLNTTSYAGGDIANVTFNFSGTPTQGRHFNVSRNAGATITFADVVSGNLGGYKYEEDAPPYEYNTGLLHWPAASDVEWTGAVSTLWEDPLNWSPNVVPTLAINAVIPGTSTGVVNHPTIGNVDAVCKNLTITDGRLTITNGFDLTTYGNIQIGTGNYGGSLTVANTTSEILCAGMWTKGTSGVFINGNSTVTFNSGSGTSTIQPGTTAFHNVIFDNVATTFTMTGATLYIDGDMTINDGIFYPNTNNYVLNIKGNFQNNGGEFNLNTFGTTKFIGAAQTIDNGTFYNVEINGTDVKTFVNGMSTRDLTINSTLQAGAASSIDINGNMTIAASGTFIDGDNEHFFSGTTWTGTGTYSGSGIVTFDGTNQNIASGTFYDLNFISTGSNQINGNITVNRNFTLNQAGNVDFNSYLVTNPNLSGTMTCAARVMYIEGANNFPTGFDIYNLDVASTAYYRGGSNQTIKGDIDYGNLTLLNTNTKTLGGNVVINGNLSFNNATLDVSTNHYLIDLKGNWYNNAATSGVFICRNGTVNFSGESNNQGIYLDANSEPNNHFNNITVNKMSGNVSINRSTTISNDLTVYGGSFSIEDNIVYVGGNFEALGGSFLSGWNGTYYLNKTGSTVNITTNNSTLRHLTINGVGTTFNMTDNLTMTGNFNLLAGTFNANGKIASIGNGPYVVNIYGTYKMGAGGKLMMAGVNLKVYAGGSLEAVGESGNIATITRNSGYYYSYNTFTVEGNLDAKYCLFEYIDVTGIVFKAGSTVGGTNAANNLSYCSFTNTPFNATLLTFENDQDLTGANKIIDATFPYKPGGTSFNVRKLTSANAVEFYNATGIFAGEAFDDDPSETKVLWTGPVTLTWTGDAGTTDWFTDGNWKASAGLGHVPIATDNVVIQRLHPDPPYNPIATMPVIDVSGAICENLNIETGGRLTITTDANAGANDLAIGGTLTVKGSLTLSSVNDYVSVEGNWLNNSGNIVNYGNVSFNGDGSVKSITAGGASFYNLSVDAVTTYQLAQTTTIVANDLTINTGTLDVSSYTLDLRGNLTNNSSLAFGVNGTLLLKATSGPRNIDAGGSTLKNVTINASGITYNLTNELTANGNFNIVAGTLDVNSHIFNFGDNAATRYLTVSGMMEIDAGASLKMANLAQMNVNAGGTLHILGADAANTANITRQSTGNYAITAQNGSNISARYYDIRYLNTNGFYLAAGSSLSAVNNFSDGKFSNGQTGGCYLRMLNNLSVGANDTIKEPEFNSGPTFNIIRTSGLNNLVVVDAKGALYSYLYEQDDQAVSPSNGLIRWVLNDPTMVWNGSVSSNFNTPANWDDMVLGGPATFPPDTNYNIQIPHAVTTPNDPYINATSGNAFGNQLTIDANGIMYMADGNDITLVGDVINSGTLSVASGSESIISAKGSWTNTGTFAKGASTVILNASTGTETISPNSTATTNTFHNLTLDGGATYRLAGRLYVGNNLTIESNATLDVSTSNYWIYLKGDFRSNGSFNSRAGYVYLEGTTVQDILTNLANMNDFYNFRKTATSTMNLLSDISVVEQFYVGGGTFNANGFTLFLEGDWYTYNSPINNMSLEVLGNEIATYNCSRNNIFNNIIINKGIGASFALNRSIQVNDTLTLTQGKLILGAYHLLLGENSSVLGGSANAYVQASSTGTIRQIYTGATVLPKETWFPIGDAALYSPFRLNLREGTFGATPYITINVTNSKHPEMDDINDVINRYWSVNQLNISDALYDVELTYNDADVVGDESVFLPGKYSTTPQCSGWYKPEDPNYWTLTTATNTLTWDSITCFSDFTAAGPTGTLPIELLDFNAEVIGSEVYVSWQTATELNNDYFTVEKTIDGKTFEYVGTIDGAGNSNTVLYYQLIDENPYQGKSYYRLKQTDFDGNYSYSELVEVNIGEGEMEKEYEVLVYPNPVRDNRMIVVLQNLSLDDVNRVKVVDLMGKTVYSATTLESYNGDSQFIIHLNGVQKGFYSLIVETKKGTKVTKVMVR